MFDPSKSLKDKAEKAVKKKAIENLKAWSLSLIPSDLQEGLIIDVNEVQCRDPTCAPIDTVFTFVWASTGKGLFAFPSSAAEITQEELVDFFPDRETLAAWKAGRRARWPPLSHLRFQVGDPVECRVGPHPIHGWVPGRVIKLFYSEPHWPPNKIFPYQILLQDGRLVIAPQDTDQYIRSLLEEDFYDEEEDDEEEWEEEDDDLLPLPDLRFQVGDRVECRVGPDPVQDWLPGRITKLYYSEPHWPPNMVLPYQIALQDGRLVLAPQDTNQYIRSNPLATPDIMSSSRYIPRADNYFNTAEYNDNNNEVELEEEEEEEGDVSHRKMEE